MGNLPHSSIVGNLPYRPTENAEHETMYVKYAHVPRHRRDFSGVKHEEPMLRARHLGSYHIFITYWLCVY